MSARPVAALALAVLLAGCSPGLGPNCALVPSDPTGSGASDMMLCGNTLQNYLMQYPSGVAVAR